jgi:hypothetical protein
MLWPTLHLDLGQSARATLRGCLAAFVTLCSSASPTAVEVEAVDELAQQSTRSVRDKAGYNLFNPVPEDLMRELAPERPDKTDCPWTLDAGHFAIEMDFANLTCNEPNSERGNTRFRAFEIAPMNLRVGLLRDLDFQLAFTTYHWEKTRNLDNGRIERKEGFDGITPRFKVNFLGNDDGFFALAAIPFVKVPLYSDHIGNSSVEGGVAIPYAFDVPGWDVGLQATFRGNRNEANAGYHAEFDNSISIGHSLIGKLSIAAEFFSSVSTERGAGWIGTVDTWLLYQINKNILLDGGINIGVTPAADDWHPWLGITWRF